jgi:hypothetical protein
LATLQFFGLSWKFRLGFQNSSTRKGQIYFFPSDCNLLFDILSLQKRFHPIVEKECFSSQSLWNKLDPFRDHFEWGGRHVRKRMFKKWLCHPNFAKVEFLLGFLRYFFYAFDFDLRRLNAGLSMK